jgi:type II secretory pathway component PulL
MLINSASKAAMTSDLAKLNPFRPRRAWIMSQVLLLRVYRCVFAVLIVVASLQALMTGAHLVAALASLEICGALLFLWQRTRIAGGTVLLLVFALAGTITMAHSQWPTHLLQYAASTIFLALVDRPRRGRGGRLAD